MQDRPTARELTTAVAHFLNQELAPTVTNPRLRFRVLIAANLMAIVTRELDAGDTPIRAEWQRLATLLDKTASEAPANAEDMRSAVEALERELCARIRAGDADTGPWRAAVVSHVQATVIDKLRVANPRFLQRMLS
jgi:hypothetical protein